MTKLQFIGLSVACALVASPALAHVEVHSIGAPIDMNGLKIEPHYLTGVEMGAMPTGAAKDEIHLEVDVHATKTEAHGFPEGAWMPYLTVKYVLTKTGSSFKTGGALRAMTAKPGPHYAANVEMAGPGTYDLSYEISPPPADALALHAGKEIGVPPWWQPFTVHWKFKYPVAD